MISQCHNYKKQTGLSLVEVLVVLVIIVIGILTVVQLFPAGFGVMRGAQNTSSADRLAQQALEDLKTNGTPDGIYAGVYDTTIGQIVVDPTIPPASLATVTTIAGQTPPTLPAPSDVNNIRYIHNETFTVNATHTITSGSTGGSTTGGTTTGGTTGGSTTGGSTTTGTIVAPIHVLNYGPIYIASTTTGSGSGSTTTADTPDSVQVNSTPWTATTGNSLPDISKGYDPTIGGYDPYDDPRQILTAGNPAYMIDYNQGEIAVAPEPYPQIFQFSVSVNNGTSTTVQSIEFTVAASYNGTWFSLTSPLPSFVTAQPSTASITSPSSQSNPPTVWVPNSATLYRPLHYMAPGKFDSDPYEFNLNEADQTAGTTVINPTVPMSSGGYFNVGVLAFNPNLANSSGTQAISVQASYMAYDWHVIHEDSELPTVGSTGLTGGTSAATTVHLAIDDLQQVGDVQADGTVSSGVILGEGGSSNVGNQYDFVFLNLDTGAMSKTYTDSDVTNDDTNPNGTNPIHVSFRNGRLTLPPLYDDFGAQIQHVRIFYRGSADWAVAVQRAPATYNSVPAGQTQAYFSQANSLVPAAYTGTVATPNLYYFQNNLSQPNANTIYFPECDTGKQITLTNVVITMPNPSSTNATSEPTVSTVIPALQLENLTTQTGGTGGYISDPLTQETPIVNAISSLNTTPNAPVTITFTGVEGVSAEAIVIWRDHNVWKEHTLDTVLQASS